MRPRAAEKLFMTGVHRSVFKAERYLGRGTFGEDVSVHLYPLRDRSGFLWALRRHEYGVGAQLNDGLSILRAGTLPPMPVESAALIVVPELYKPLPRKRRRR
jgi:hypothetical protein